MAFALLIHKPSSNWFLTWDKDSANDGKCFLLQIKLQNVNHRQIRSDGPNVYAVVYRRYNGAVTYTKVGTTSLIKDDRNPEFPDGFRIYFDQYTDLSDDMLKIICFHRRELPPSHEYVIGAATITIRELVRTFGARVNVELVRQHDGRSVGGVWFLAEPLPVRSPRGGSNVMEFTISVLPPRRTEIKFQTTRIFIVVERQRNDMTWSAVYRSEVFKRDGVKRLNKKARIYINPFEIRQGELVLGMTAMRKIRFSLFQKGKKGESHVRLGEVISSVDELMNEFQVDTSLDVRVNSQIVGEFANVGRLDENTRTSLNIEVNYFNGVLSMFSGRRDIIREESSSSDQS